MSPRRTVLVTAIGGGGFGDQILKALRLADRYRIIGADANPRVAQFKSVDQSVTLPRADHPDYTEAVTAVCDHFEVEALLPGSEPELVMWSKNRHVLESRGVLLPVASPELIEIGMDKRKTGAALASAGFRTPRWVEASGPDELASIDWFPVVVKPAIGGGGSKDTHIAQSRRELEIVGELLAHGSSPVLVQEYVGHPDGEYTVGVLHDLDGVPVNSIAVRRQLEGGLSVRMATPNRTGRAELGTHLVVSSGISMGEVGQFPDVTSQCEAMAAALELRGTANFQCRLVDGEVMIFEINPRFSGTTSIRALMGYNEPDWLLRYHLDDEDLPRRFAYRSGSISRTLLEAELPTADAPMWRDLG